MSLPPICENHMFEPCWERYTDICKVCFYERDMFVTCCGFQNYHVWHPPYIRSKYLASKIGIWTHGIGREIIVYRGIHKDVPVVGPSINIPKKSTWKDIFDTFNRWGCKEYYPAFVLYCNQRPDFDNDIDVDFLIYIDKKFTLYNEKYHWKRSNNLNVWYLILKIMQLKGKDFTQVPYKGLASTTKTLDKCWKDICLEEGFVFQPTPCQILFNW